MASGKLRDAVWSTLQQEVVQGTITGSAKQALVATLMSISGGPQKSRSLFKMDLPYEDRHDITDPVLLEAATAS